MTKVNTSTGISWSLRFQKTFGAILAAVALVIVCLPAFTASTAKADDPVYSPGEKLGEKHAVSGRVFLDRAGSRSYMEPADKQGASDGDLGLGGAKVYAQWTDYNNRRQKGALSPVYYTQARSDGTYVIQLPDWTDSFGTVHKWEATAGQTLRIWADNPDPSKYTLAFVEGDSIFGGQGDRYRGTWNGVIGFNLAENYNIAFQERPQFDQMFPAENTWKQSSREGGGGDVIGLVWYEERESLGNAEAVPTFKASYGEVKVPGVKVVGTYVQDEVARRFDQWKKDHKNYKRDEFKVAQREIMKAYEAETGKSAIAETIYDTTDANGKYHLQFQGLWGNSYNAKGIMNAGSWGELVPEGTKASWAADNLRSRHVNTEYMYVAPVLPDGVGGALNNFRDNMYQSGTNWFPNASTGSISNVENVNFALRIEGRDFHIETYDQTTNPAKPGDTAPTKATGFVPSNTYDIVWTDGDGNEVKTCTTKASNLGVVESCDFTVPADLAKGEIYTASIYPGGFDQPVRDRAMAKDSFAAKITPEYKTTTIDLDDTATVAAPINKENSTTPPADTTYAAAAASDVPASLLEGVDQAKVAVGAQPWAKVNSDGTISLSPTNGSVTPGSYLIPVKMTYGQGKDAYERVILAPVTVQDPNVDGDGDGVSDDKDKCAGTPKGAKVGNDGCSLAPTVGKVPGITGQVNKEITPVNVPVDNPGKAKLTACSAEGLPAGLAIALNEQKDGCVISGTPSEEAKDKEVTVKVSFEPVDKTDQHKGGEVTGTATATISVEADGDNDTVPDSKDKCAGTPAGAQVDANGCSVKPTAGDPVAISGQKGKEIAEVVVVPVDNPGMATVTCSSDSLPAGLSVKYSAEKKACVVSGTPSEEVKDKAVTVNVNYDPQDGDDTSNPAGSVPVNTTATITDPSKDSDGDGVPDASDKCAGTPAGAQVDANGCAVVPVVGDFKVTGMVGKAISPVSVKVTNDGKASDLSCVADELTAVGLTVKFDAASSACVISGTPTKSIDKQVDLTVGFKHPDGTKDAGTVKKSGSVYVAKDDDGDGVADPKDPANPVAGEDKCPGTPKDAKIDNDGCSVPPTVGKIAPIVGEKDSPITSVTVPVDNPGKSKLTACKAEGLPAGLSIALNKEGTACVISGTPTEIVDPGKDVNVTVSFEPVDKSADHPGGDIQGKTSVTIKDNLSDADRYNPAYPAVTGKPGESVKASQTGDKNVPDTARYVLGDNAPQGASIDAKTGQVTLNIPDTAKNGEEITVPVKVNYADNSADNATVTVKVRTDKDGDGKPDPVDPENPQAGDDLCPGTPAADKDKVDEFGCTLADRWNPSYADVNGQVGKPAVSAAPVFDEVTTKDKTEKAVAPAGTKFALGEDAPEGVSIDAETGVITWDEPVQGDTEIPVKVTYKDGTTDKVTAKFVIALPGDDDGDGVPNDKDKCAGTPKGAEVDGNGCSVAPSLPDAPKITGEKGKAIDPVDVPVNNPGKTKVTACQATGLPAGLTIEWNEGKQACVISGTPTEEVTDGKVTITVDYTPQDKTDQHPGGKASGETTVTITDPAKDGDGDGVADNLDKCANTPKGAAVDKNGCALAPSVPAIPNIEGQKDKPLNPMVVPVDNPGKATITSCKAEGLPKGLSIKWDEKRSACVISGTPTEIVTGQKVTISIDYTAPDGAKKPGSTKIETMVTIKSADREPQDVVPGSGLPKTGAPVLGLSLLALALTIAGMGTLTARRRRS